MRKRTHQYSPPFTIGRLVGTSKRYCKSAYESAYPKLAPNSASPVHPTKKPYGQRQRQIYENSRALQIRSMAPLVEPQEEKDSTGEIAKANVNDHTKSRASFFRIQSVEMFAPTVFFLELARPFRDSVECCAANCAEASGCQVRSCEAPFPAYIRRTRVVVVVEVKLIVRDGSVRGQVFGRAWCKVVAQISGVRKPNSQTGACVYAVLLE